MEKTTQAGGKGGEILQMGQMARRRDNQQLRLLQTVAHRLGLGEVDGIFATDGEQEGQL